MKRLIPIVGIFLLILVYILVEIPNFNSPETDEKLTNNTNVAGTGSCPFNIAKLDTIADEIASEKFPNMTNCGHAGCFNLTTCTAVVFIHIGPNREACTGNYSVYKAVINMKNWEIISLENSTQEDEKNTLSKCGSTG
ncbi:hypothetical protein E3E23_06425 [Thermococcus sp. CX2]|uniref:hypothetical protein n=1 Tax=Thermococcus sp. CX2 TaxID=163006 RepID=UPI0014399ED7|nr:hypothetical protein [Thermococcus sp. CX2]NJE85458.1 hypothetical protein [Thermococcus sp. CX2]